MPSLAELPCEDVTFAHIFPSLNLRDLFRLRSASKEVRILVDTYFTRWKTLDLSDYPCIGSAAFGVLLDSCSDLNSVNLRNHRRLVGEKLVLLLEKHPNLGCLDLSACNDESLRRIFINFTKCSNLTTVKLKKCHWIDEGFLIQLARCEKLQSVVLADCSQITDSSIVLFCRLCQRLSYLSLENLIITDDALVQALPYCSQSIRVLCLRGCSLITDKGLLALRSLPFLTRLEVSGCRHVTERGLAPLRGRVDIDLPPRPICQPRPLNLQV